MQIIKTKINSAFFHDLALINPVCAADCAATGSLWPREKPLLGNQTCALMCWKGEQSARNVFARSCMRDNYICSCLYDAGLSMCECAEETVLKILVRTTPFFGVSCLLRTQHTHNRTAGFTSDIFWTLNIALSISKYWGGWITVRSSLLQPL